MNTRSIKMPGLKGGTVSQLSATVLLITAVFTSAVAQAGPTRQALDAAAEAVYLDFARDGVVASPDEVRGEYQEACDLGYDLACRPERWHGPDGMAKLELAGPIFEKACGRQDPVACVVAGWAIEAEPISEDLELEERRQRQLNQLEKASDKYFKGCQSAHWSACLELGRYSYARYGLGVDPDSELDRFKRGARDMYRTYCSWGHSRACVARGELEPQAPELLDTRGSAGYLYRQACDEGYTPGCYRQGLLVAPMRSMAESRHWFDGLCDRGHTASCEWVARSYADEAATSPETSPEYLSAWKRACFLHSSTGCSLAGPLLEESNPAEARQVHRMGCALGEGMSCGRLGMMLHQGGEQVASVSFLDRGCEAGMTEACVQVGLMRLDGSVIDSDPQQARQDLEKGCPEDGVRDAQACHALGSIYQRGVGSEQDRIKAAAYFDRACRDDHIDSCYQLGQSVTSLQPASQNARPALVESALRGFVKACDAGLEESCLPAADLFATGPAQVVDSDEARRRYEDLVQVDDEKRAAKAALQYGLWLRSRRAGTTQDLEHAREVFKKGMKLGNTEAARQYAIMLHMGIGGSKRKRKANNIFADACAAGNAEACGGVRIQGIARP